MKGLVTMKVCKKCGTEKELACFSKNKTYKDGHNSACKECKAQATRAWYKANKERAMNTKQAHYLANKEAIQDYKKQYYLANKEAELERSRLWRESNKDHLAEYSRANIERMKAATRRRRALKRQQTGYMPKGWFEAMTRVYGYQCAQCGTKEKISVDHVVALANGGLDEISNLQFLCVSHNSAKRDYHNTDYRTVRLVDTVTS